MTSLETERLTLKLNQLSELLLSRNSSSHWGRMIESVAKKDTLSAEDMRLHIKGWYGGMGSINDVIVFCADGTIDREASEEFDKLRTELYNFVKYPTT